MQPLQQQPISPPSSSLRPHSQAKSACHLWCHIKASPSIRGHTRCFDWQLHTSPLSLFTRAHEALVATGPIFPLVHQPRAMLAGRWEWQTQGCVDRLTSAAVARV